MAVGKRVVVARLGVPGVGERSAVGVGVGGEGMVAVHWRACCCWFAVRRVGACRLALEMSVAARLSTRVRLVGGLVRLAGGLLP